MVRRNTNIQSHDCLPCKDAWALYCSWRLSRADLRYGYRPGWETWGSTNEPNIPDWVVWIYSLKCQDSQGDGALRNCHPPVEPDDYVKVSVWNSAITIRVEFIRATTHPAFHRRYILLQNWLHQCSFNSNIWVYPVFYSSPVHHRWYPLHSDCIWPN